MAMSNRRMIIATVIGLLLVGVILPIGINELVDYNAETTEVEYSYVAGNSGVIVMANVSADFSTNYTLNLPAGAQIADEDFLLKRIDWNITVGNSSIFDTTTATLSGASLGYTANVAVVNASSQSYIVGTLMPNTSYANPDPVLIFAAVSAAHSNPSYYTIYWQVNATWQYTTDITGGGVATVETLVGTMIPVMGVIAIMMGFIVSKVRQG